MAILYLDVMQYCPSLYTDQKVEQSLVSVETLVIPTVVVGVMQPPLVHFVLHSLAPYVVGCEDAVTVLESVAECRVEMFGPVLVGWCEQSHHPYCL